MNDVFRKRVRLNIMELLVSVINNNPVSMPYSSGYTLFYLFIHSTLIFRPSTYKSKKSASAAFQ